MTPEPKPLSPELKPRHKTHAVVISKENGALLIGSDAPIVVQSMTSTDTADVEKTVRQIVELADAGAELVRVTVNAAAAAKAVPHIRDQIRLQGRDIPLAGDFHFNGHILLKEYPECARALAKYRINPGNVGAGGERDSQFASMIETAVLHGKVVRIGVNWGSLDQALLQQKMDENAARPVPWPVQSVQYEALIDSALNSAAHAEKLGLPADRIVLSCKVSAVADLIAIYRELARRSSYALHLGLTEAGPGTKGIVASASALAVLLAEGIGDTIRISITPDPGQPRAKEVIVAQELLQSMGLRHFMPAVISCPGCGRTRSAFFQELASTVSNYLVEQMPQWRLRYPGVETMTVAVMGCVVNGPGEAQHANIGISLPGAGETPAALVFEDGRKKTMLRGENLDTRFLELVLGYVQRKYG